MKTITIEAYDYNDLLESSKASVRVWLDEVPIEVENDKGEFEFRYFSDMTDIEIDEHCQANGYLFTESGRPIHHLERVADKGIWIEPSKSEEEQGITRRASRV